MASFKLSIHLNSSLLLFLIILPSIAKTSIRSPLMHKGNGTRWAVLVAGSRYISNYRHQADVCHAYQILKRGGLKDENIVVFMYDDIANHVDNPRRGIIINHPNGSDVYAGVPKDYTGDNATVENLYNVLLGNRAGLKGGSGKVVDSKPEDRIFIYYSDHGGAGVLEMPTMPALFADDFIKVLKRKHAAGTYKEMVIYLEACEGGSIFEGLLPEDMNIYVATASNATENSWGTYCPDSDPPAPHDFYVCIGDLYSVAWMEDSETHNLNTETLGQQYNKVKKRTFNNHSKYGSHVMEYGTKRMKSEGLYLYQGFSANNSSADLSYFDNKVVSGIDQREADLIYLRRKYNRLTDESEEKATLFVQITDITNHRTHMASTIEKIGSLLFGQEKGNSVLSYIRDAGLPVVDDWGCLKSTVHTFETHCGILTSYGLKYMRAFANICNNGVPRSAIEEAIKEACNGYNLGQWNPINRGYTA